MKKFLAAAALSLLIFSGQTEAATIDNLNAPTIEIQETGTSSWAHFRDKYLLGRETANERRDRHEWERRHGYHDRHHDRHYYDRHDRHHRHRRW